MVPQQPPHALPCKFLTSERRYHPSSVLRARSGPAPSKRRLMVFFSLSKTKCLFCSTCKLLSARCATRRRNFGTSQNLRQIPPLQRDSARRLHTSPLQPGRQIPSSAGIMQVLRLEVRSTSPHHLQRTVHDPRHHAPLLVGGHFVLIPSPFLATGLSDCSPPQLLGQDRRKSALDAPVCTEDSQGDAGSRPRTQSADRDRAVTLASCRGGAVGRANPHLEHHLVGLTVRVKKNSGSSWVRPEDCLVWYEDWRVFSQNGECGGL